MAMFTPIHPHELIFNPFKSIGKQWMLITAGDEEKCNTMTASWGGAGVLWNKNVVTCFIRPQRYTREFMDAKDYFSLNFLPGQYRDRLSYCGIVSGRNENKIAKTGLTVCHDYEAPCFEEAEKVLICKKLYVDTLKPECITADGIDKTFYAEQDYHFVYIGEIVQALIRQ